MARHILISDGPAQPNPADIDAFWVRACDQLVDLGDDYQVRSLGIDAETTTQILEYIKTRDKVATFSLPWVIDANGASPARHPHCALRLRRSHLIVRLTDVRNNVREIGYAESSLDAHRYRTPMCGYRYIASTGTACWLLTDANVRTICRCWSSLSILSARSPDGHSSGQPLKLH